MREEEGEKAKGAELGNESGGGEKVQKIVGEGEGDGTAKTGGVQLENNTLAKDW